MVTFFILMTFEIHASVVHRPVLQLLSRETKQFSFLSYTTESSKNPCLSMLLKRFLEIAHSIKRTSQFYYHHSQSRTGKLLHCQLTSPVNCKYTHFASSVIESPLSGDSNTNGSSFSRNDIFPICVFLPFIKYSCCVPEFS